MNPDPFQVEVLESLAVLRTQMTSLLGNGQPGRLSTMETDIKANTAFDNKVKGVLIFIGAPIGLAVLTLCVRAIFHVV